MPVTVPNGYGYARTLTVSTTTAVGGSSTTPVPIHGPDYVCRLYLTGATALAVFALCQDQVAGTDLAIFDGLTQLDSDLETFSSSAISMWFKLQRPIGASSSDSNYLLAYGSPNPTAMRNWSNIYCLSDDFNAGALDLSKWTNYNGVNISFAGSVMTLVNSTTTAIHGDNCAVQSNAVFPLGYALRAKGTMPLPTITNVTYIHSSLRFVNGDQSQIGTPGIRNDALLWSDPANTAFTSPPSDPTHWLVSSFDDDGSGHFSAAGVLAAIDNAIHVFNLGRDLSTGNAYGWIDEGAVLHTTTQPTSVDGHVWMDPDGYDNPNCVTQTWDWIKIKPFVASEPTVSVGAQVVAQPIPFGWPWA